MGSKGGDEAAKEAQQARADEQARQERIRQGTARISQIFEGGALSGTDKLAAGAKYDPTKKYYTSSGAVWTPPSATPTPVTYKPGVAGTGSYQNSKDSIDQNNKLVWQPGQPTAAAAKTPEQLFNEAVAAGQVFGGQARSQGTFSPDYYKNLQKSYVDYATPQLVDQYSGAKQQLIYAMDRAGLTNSSVNAVKQGDLTKLYNTGKQNIVATANDYVNKQKTAVEDARQNLIQTLNATGDAQGAATSAINRAQSLSASPNYSPLGQLFADFTAGLGQQGALEQAAYYSGQPVARYNTGVFTPNKKSVVVT